MKTNKSAQCLCCLLKNAAICACALLSLAAGFKRSDRRNNRACSWDFFSVLRGVDHRHTLSTCDCNRRLSRDPPCLKRSNCKGTLWSACACRPTALNWQELLAAPMCSRISFPWRDFAERRRLRGRVRIPARNFPKLSCRQLTTRSSRVVLIVEHDELLKSLTADIKEVEGIGPVRATGA